MQIYNIGGRLVCINKDLIEYYKKNIFTIYAFKEKVVNGVLIKIIDFATEIKKSSMSFLSMPSYLVDRDFIKLEKYRIDLINKLLD